MHRTGFRGETVPFVTPLVDAQQDRVDDLADLFWSRWGIETNLGHLKTPMGREVLTCKTVNGVLKALMVFALIAHVGRLGRGHAARRQHVAIDRISFIEALRWLGTAQDDELLPTLVVPPPSRSLRAAGTETTSKALSSHDKAEQRIS